MCSIVSYEHMSTLVQIRLSQYLNCERKLLWESRNLDDASLDDMVPDSKNSPGKQRFVPKTISLDEASKSSLV